MRPTARTILCSFFAVVVGGCGQNNEPPPPSPSPEPAPAVTHTITPDQKEEQESITSAQGLFDYIPDDFTVVAGLRPRTLLASTSTKEESKESDTVLAMLKRAGLDPATVDQVYTGARRDTGDVLVILRVVGTLNESAIKEKLGLQQPVETIDNREVFKLPENGDVENGLTFLDRRTAMLGRLKTVTRALADKGSKEQHKLQQAQRVLGKAAAPFWISVSDGPAKVAMVESLVPGLEAKEYGTVQSLAMTISESPVENTFGSTKTVDAVFTFERDTQSSAFARSLEAGLKAFEKSLEEQREAAQSIKVKPKGPPEEEGQQGAEPENSGRNSRSDSSSANSSAPGDPANSQSRSDSSAGSSSSANSSGPAGSGSSNNNASQGSDSIKVEGSLVRVRLIYEDGQMGPAISKAVGLAHGGSPIDDGVFPGSLAPLADGLKEYWAKEESPMGARPPISENNVMYLRYSWMCSLLPHLGHYDVYDRFEFEKEWLEEPNFVLTRRRIPEFLNPAAKFDRWQGFPFDGMALTHFVGMAGVEESRNDLAAEYSREDPRAGIFGYDRIAKPEEVTDGLAQTIMIIGSENVPGPWVQAGGSTIRGAREPFFSEAGGFRSDGIPGGGTYVLMADGSMRTISKDIDPKVFKAMCTAHGADSVDLSSKDSN